MDVKGRAERIRAITEAFDRVRLVTALADSSRSPLTAEQVLILATQLKKSLNDILDQEFEHGADHGSRLAAEYMMKNYEIHDTWDRG